MGNRATVIFQSGERVSPAIYLHWNGGPESVYAFLDALDRRGVRPDGDYDAARFVQTVGNFLDRGEVGGLSLGLVNGPGAIDPEALGYVWTDHSDNGFYVVNRAEGIVRRFEETRSGIVEWERGRVEAEHARAIKTAQYRGIVADLIAVDQALTEAGA